jgi:hypothetical protein
VAVGIKARSFFLSTIDCSNDFAIVFGRYTGPLPMHLGAPSGAGSVVSLCSVLSFDGKNTWISVVGGGNANITLTSVADSLRAGDCGQGTYTVQLRLIGSYIFYQNSDATSTSSNNGLGQAPSCFVGGMVITSDVPIAVLVGYTNDLNPGDSEDMYPALLPVPTGG